MFYKKNTVAMSSHIILLFLTKTSKEIRLRQISLRKCKSTLEKSRKLKWIFATYFQSCTFGRIITFNNVWWRSRSIPGNLKLLFMNIVENLFYVISNLRLLRYLKIVAICPSDKCPLGIGHEKPSGYEKEWVWYYWESTMNILENQALIKRGLELVKQSYVWKKCLSGTSTKLTYP